MPCRVPHFPRSSPRKRRSSVAHKLELPPGREMDPRLRGDERKGMRASRPFVLTLAILAFSMPALAQQPAPGWTQKSGKELAEQCHSADPRQARGVHRLHHRHLRLAVRADAAAGRLPAAESEPGEPGRCRYRVYRHARGRAGDNRHRAEHRSLLPVRDPGAAAAMNAGLVIFPGINRERDMAIALERSVGRPPRIVWHTETDLSASISSSCPAVSATATTCAAGRWRPNRRSCVRCGTSRRAAAMCSASATASKS